MSWKAPRALGDTVRQERTTARLLCLPLLLVVAIPCSAQGLPESINVRIRNLSSLPSVKAASECGALLQRIEGNKTLSLQGRAGGLDRLRDACSKKLAWTDPLLARIAERAVASRRSRAQEEPAALCQGLRVLGLSYHYLGKIQEAHRLYDEAVAVARRFRGRGTTDEDVAAALDSLSSLLLDLGKLPEALQAAEDALRLRRQAVPFLPEKVVTALTTRARVEERLDLRAARDTLLEAHRLGQQLGPEHSSEVSRVASNLGEILHRLGELPRAITFLQEAEKLRLRDRRLGRPARQLAATQLLLGKLFFDLNDYPQAIEYYRKAVQGHHEWLGKDPYRFGDVLTGLATVLEESGLWDEALVMQREVLTLREAEVRKAASQNQGDAELQLMLARSLTRVGSVQQRMGSTEARRSLERALTIQERVLGKLANADRAETLAELAEHWSAAGDPQRARALIERCLRELGSLGEQGPLLVKATELSARLAADPAAGLRILDMASRQVHRLYGESSPRAAGVLQVKAELRRRQGNALGALDDALRSQKLSLPHVKSIVQAFPRDQALAFAADRRQSLHLALHLLSEHPDLSPSLVEKVWQTALGSRMLVRDAEIDRQQLLRATANPQLALVAKRLAAARERFAYLLVQTHGTIETQAIRLKEAQRELLDAEAALATKTRFLLATSAAEVSLQQLRRRLPNESALVAIYQYRQPAGRDAYLAFVLNGSEPARAVLLGETVTIDWLVQQWRDAILSPRADAKARTAAGQALRRKIWDPIARALAGTRTVFVVPDGSLHLVPLIALPTQDGKYLIEQGWAFHSLTAERDLLRPSGPVHDGPWLALGGVDYRQSADQSGGTVKPSRDVVRGDVLRGDDCARRGLPSFSPLPGSRAEIQDLALLWKRLPPDRSQSGSALTTLSGPKATEQALRREVPGRRIVHLATHGFAQASGCRPAQPAVRGIGGLSLGSGADAPQPWPLSGLVLAGANDRGKALRSDEDGILTEEEILGLDLSAADWVVLSACETGLGKIRPGEGVVGMLRAFQVAGAKTIIVSLWSVRDQAARGWMRELYAARFERRLSTLEAMRQAALRRLKFYRTQGNDNPADWAGFVASGQWN